MERKIVALVRKYMSELDAAQRLDHVEVAWQNYCTAIDAAEEKGYLELALAASTEQDLQDETWRRAIAMNLDDPITYHEKQLALVEKYKQYL